MPLSFPLNPSLNQTYTYSGVTWTYNGSGWSKTGSGSSLANNSVQGNYITTGAITADKLATDSVTTTKILDYAVSSTKLANTGVTAGTYGSASSVAGITIGQDGRISAATNNVINPAAVSDKNNTSTGYFDLPTGTTAQRPASPDIGAMRYNTTTGYAEIYTSNGWALFGRSAPTISSVSPASYNGDQGTQFTIMGTEFTTDSQVKFIDNLGFEYTAASIQFVSSTELRATTPQDFTVAQEPLDVKVITPAGVTTRIDCIDCGGTPSWTTASGSLWANAADVAINIQLQASDPDSGALTYAITTGSLPSGVTMSSSGLISGTPSVAVTTTFNFTVRATDVGGNTADRAFSITIYPVLATPNSYPLSSGQYSLYTTGWTSSSANLYDLTHAASTFTVPANIYAIRVVVWGGGAVFNNAVTGGNGGYTDAILRVNPGDRFKVIVANAGTIASGTGGSGGSGLGGGCSQDGNDNGVGGAGSGVFFAANSSLTTVTVEATMFSKGVLIAGGGGCAGQSSTYPGGNGNGGGSATALTVAGISGLGIAGGSGTGPNLSNGGKFNGSGGDMIHLGNTVAVTGPGRGLGGGRADDGYGSSCGAGAGGGSGAGGGGGGCPIAWSGTGENATGDGGRGVTFYSNTYNTNTGPGAGGTGSYYSMGGNGMRFNGINLGGGGAGGHGASNAGGGWGGGGSSYYAWGGGGGSGCAFGYLTGTTPTLSSWVNPTSVTVNGGNANSVCGVPTTSGASKGSSTSGSGYNGAVLIMW